MGEYLEILCPICGRGMGEKAIRRVKKHRGSKPIVLKKEDYLDFMLRNYDFDKKMVIIRETGKAGFGEYKIVDYKNLPKEKKEKFKKLVLNAIKFLMKKRIIKKEDISFPTEF